MKQVEKIAGSAVRIACSVHTKHNTNKEKTNSVALIRERTIPTERPPLVGEVSADSADRGCCVVSTTDPYGSILRFLDRNKHNNNNNTIIIIVLYNNNNIVIIIIIIINRHLGTKIYTKSEKIIFFLISFYLPSVLVHSANCV
jgi:hypothetical protein